MSILLRRRAYHSVSPVVYTPVLPDDTAKYPMYLKGWAKYTVTQVSTVGTNTVAYYETGIDGKNPSTCYCSDYDGIVNTTSLANTPNKSAKYGFTTASMRDRCYLKDTDVGTTVEEWNAYLATHPIDVLFELETSDDSVWFAVTDGTNYGYYCPASGKFVAVYGMTGTVIQRVEFASFTGSQYVTTGYQLTGADTVEMDFSYSKSGCNIFGSWRSSNADVFTLYASTNRSYVRYGSSLYRETSIPLNERVAYSMTPTGDYLDGVKCNSWSQLDFATGKFAIVGWLDGSSSPKLEGDVYEFGIENHVHLVPVKVGTEYYLFDELRWEMPAHTGTLDGGAVITDTIPFPDEIPNDAPVLLMMGAPNPNPEPEPDPEPEPEPED